MKWKHDKKETKEEVNYDRYTKVDTCCECEIYIQVQQTFDFNYTIVCPKTKICDIHREAALEKYKDKVRSILI